MQTPSKIGIRWRYTGRDVPNASKGHESKINDQTPVDGLIDK
jgi:hypothetical protein